MLNILKKNFEKENKENTNLLQKNKNNEKIIDDLQSEINKLKNENFTLNNKIKEQEKEQKKYESKILENTSKLNSMTSEKANLSKVCADLRNKITEQQKSYESKIIILEKQLKHLSDANSNFVVENNKVQTQLKDFQILTNMAKVNTKKLKKEDFSILEVMSNRAEKAEMEVQKLSRYVEQLRNVRKIKIYYASSCYRNWNSRINRYRYSWKYSNLSWRWKNEKRRRYK